MKNSGSVILGCSIILLVLFLCLCFSIFVISVGASLSIEDNFALESTYRAGDNDDKIAIIDIAGPIIGGQSADLFGNVIEDPVAITISQLEKAQEEDDVKVVLLRFNTGGGTVYDSFLIADKVREIREEGKKNVVSLVETSAASGGYLIASQSDFIVSSKTSILGSIGVIAEITDTDGLLENLGIETVRITSDGAEQKSGEDILDPTSPEYQNLKELLNDYQQLFNEYVADGRELDLARVTELADGSISSGLSAQEKGLIDEFGDLDKAIELIEAEYDIKGAQVVIYTEDMESLFGSIESLSNWFPGIVSRKDRGLEVIF